MAGNMEFLIGKQISERYKIDALLAEGGMSFLFRGTNTKENKPVAVKVLKLGASSSRVADVIRFRREALAASKLNHPNLIKIYETGECEGLNYIVMEFVPGEGLDEYIRKKPKLELTEALGIVLQTAAALQAVHSAGIIHRDLKPGNLLISPEESGPRIKLVDFGLAQIMEMSQIKETKSIAGTFSYMSPEQSGIIQKPVDERSDLYSLGIIFYQLLTGALPFKGETVSAILHQQIARQPAPPEQINPDIPDVIGRIVLKLLKKDPEERYQSAEGLHADIKKYITGKGSFILGMDDHLKNLTYHTRMIGREKELNKLKNLYTRTQEGQGCVCLISGEVGRGKSRLVTDFRDYVYAQGGELIYGKCFDQTNKIPYQPFSEALDEYLSRNDKLPAQEKEARIARMRQSLGDLGDIICRLNPLMRDILGPTASPAELDPGRENSRFLMVCSKFFRELGAQGHPLVIALDDLQWADEGTLSLVKEIMEEAHGTSTLVLGMYRDSEISTEHSLAKIIQEAEGKQAALEKIKIMNLDVPSVTHMLSELLLEEESELYVLSKYIHEKSRGNPFFALEIVRQLVEYKALARKQKHWEIDWERIKEISISPTILDMLMKRINALSKEQAELLSTAAAIGKTFKIDLLYKLVDLPKENIINLIDESIRMQFLQVSIEHGSILFSHDRIKDACYQHMAPEKKAKTHLKIARILEEVSRDHPERFLFDLAHHYAAAGDKEKSLQYGLPAAQKAQQGYANEEALQYYAAAIKILEEKKQTLSLEWVRAKQGLTETLLTVGKNDEAIACALEILPVKKTPMEKSHIYRQIGEGYFNKGNWLECERTLAQALALLGEKIPQKKGGIILSIAKEALVHFLHMAFSTLFLHKKGRPVREEDKRIILIANRLIWMYVLTDNLKFVRSILRFRNRGERDLEKSVEQERILGGYGSLLMALPLFKPALTQHEQALAMAREIGDEWGVGRHTQMIGFCYAWHGEPKKAIEYFEKARDKFQRLGDLWELGMTLDGMARCLRSLGQYEKAIECHQLYREISIKTKNDFGIVSSMVSLGLCHIEQGNLAEADKLLTATLNLSKEKNLNFIAFSAYIYKGFLAMEKRTDYNSAVQLLEKAKKLHEKNNFLKEYTAAIFPLLIEARTEKLRSERSALTSAEVYREHKTIKKLYKQALKETKNWPNFHSMAARAGAKYFALIGNKKKAEELFLKSIADAKKVPRMFDLGKGYYEYAAFLDAQNRDEARDLARQKAYKIFRKIGSQAYIRELMEMLGVKEAEEIKETAQQRLSEELKFASVISVGHHLSSILDLDTLLARIMDSSIEISGAERGFLFLYSENNEDKKLKLHIASNIDKESFKADEFSVSRTIIEKVEKSREAEMIIDASGDESLKNQTSVIKYNLRSILCAPIISRGNILGLVYLDNHLVSGLFSTDKMRLLKMLLSQAAISIENARATRELKNMQAQIKRHAEELEQKVKERTLELEAKNILLIDHARKVEEANSKKTEFVSDVSHELRTPLASIKGFTATMLNDEDMIVSTRRDFLRIVEEETDRLTRIIDDLLDLSRIESGKITLKKQKIQLPDLIKKSVAAILPQAEEKHLKIKVEIPEEFPFVLADPDKMLEVIINFLSNAIKYTREGEIGIAARTDNGDVLVEVSDTGIGIRTEDLSKVFEKFQRIEKTEDEAKGTGLGLSIVKALIELHGGKVFAESEAGKGSKFGFTLPVSHSHAEK